MDGLVWGWEEGSVNIEENLLCSGIGTLLQRNDLFQDIPHVWTISGARQSNKWIPVANVYTLRCGPPIVGGKCRQVSLYCQRDCFLSDFHCVWVS